MWTDEQLQVRANVAMYAARASAKQRIARDLRTRSGALFAVDKEEIARYLRDVLAPELGRDAAKDRKLQVEQQTEFNRLLDEGEQEGHRD